MKKPKQDRIQRMCNACLDYTEGKMTLKQVWYRVRGHTNCMLIQKYFDKTLSQKLFFLYLDFETWYGDQDYIVEESIFAVANYLKNLKKQNKHLRLV